MRGPAQHHTYHVRTPVHGRGIPIISSQENKQGLCPSEIKCCWRQRLSSWETPHELTSNTAHSAQVGAKSVFSINLVNTVHTNLVIPSNLHRIQLTCLTWAFFSVSHRKATCLGLCCRLQKPLKGLQTPDEHTLASACTVPLAKLPHVWHKW